ncbi:unnamed protein product [Caretta caretta]
MRLRAGSGQRLVCGNREGRFLLGRHFRRGSGPHSRALKSPRRVGEGNLFFKSFKYSCTTRKKKKHFSE